MLTEVYYMSLRAIISTYMRIYTQRGFLYCLFGMIGFPRTTMSE